MRKLTEKQLIARDAKRDLGAGLLQAVREMKAGKGVRVATKVRASFLRDARQRPGNPPMINERLRKRLKKDRPTTTITMRIPVDVVESLKAIAPTRGFTAYQTLLKSYISEGLRRDEAEFEQKTAHKLADALKRRGVPDSLLQEALEEVQRA